MKVIADLKQIRGGVRERNMLWTTIREIRDTCQNVLDQIEKEEDLEEKGSAVKKNKTCLDECCYDCKWGDVKERECRKDGTEVLFCSVIAKNGHPACRADLVFRKCKDFEKRKE